MHMKHPVGVNMGKDIITMQTVLMLMNMVVNFMIPGPITLIKDMNMKVKRITRKVQYFIYNFLLLGMLIYKKFPDRIFSNNDEVKDHLEHISDIWY